MLFIIAIVFFVLLVIVHEFGHYIAAKRNGVEVEEFGIGFPPKIASKKMGKGFWRTNYSLNLLPLGGFVRLLGETDDDTRKHSFGSAPLNAKVKIMLAGVFMNLLAAILIFTFLAFVGIPKFIPNQYLPDTGDKSITMDDVYLGYIEPESPASNAGIVEGDSIVSLAGNDVNDADDLSGLTEQYSGETIEIVVKDRSGSTESLTATLNESENDQGYLGVIPTDIETYKYTYSAPLVGTITTLQFGYETLKGLGNLVADLFTAQFSEAAENVSGPVGIVVILNSTTEFGIYFVLALIGLISLTLAIMNALPIPALDGGRLAVTLFYRLRGKKLTAKKEQAIHGTGFAVLMILILLVTIVDIDRFF